MKLTTLILPAISGAVWGAISFGQISRGVPFDWFMTIPLIMFGASVIPAAVLSQTKWSAICNIWSIMALFLIVPYGCFSGGGV